MEKEELRFGLIKWRDVHGILWVVFISPPNFISCSTVIPEEENRRLGCLFNWDSKLILGGQIGVDRVILFIAVGGTPPCALWLVTESYFDLPTLWSRGVAQRPLDTLGGFDGVLW